MNHISTRGRRALAGAVSFCLEQLLLALLPCNNGWAGADDLIFGKPDPFDRLLVRTGYTCGYSASDRQPRWTSYVLTAAELTNAIVSRAGCAFRTDPTVPGVPATPEDYLRSGYDRGHIAPAADMRWSPLAMGESFLMSNMSPQRPGFNRGIWSHLEAETRRIALERGSVCVISGPVFSEADTNSIGRSRVRIPGRFFKVIYDGCSTNGQAIAFILPNSGSDEPLAAYACSVDDVERETGLDLLDALEDEAESRIESERPDPVAWGLEPAIEGQ